MANASKSLTATGEDEVLRFVAPKARLADAPLWKTIRETAPDRVYEDMKCHSAASLGINAERFAYFGLSLVWRAAAADWVRPDGANTPRMDLDEYYEPVRRYLAGEAEFPGDTYVTLAVCTDDEPREYWMPPTRSGEIDGVIVMPIMGLAFRFFFGPTVPPPVRRTLFFPSVDKLVFSHHCWDILKSVFEPLFPGAPTR